MLPLLITKFSKKPAEGSLWGEAGQSMAGPGQGWLLHVFILWCTQWCSAALKKECTSWA